VRGICVRFYSPLTSILSPKGEEVKKGSLYHPGERVRVRGHLKSIFVLIQTMKDKVLMTNIENRAYHSCRQKSLYKILQNTSQGLIHLLASPI
jgi:hypothetical protein